MSETIPGGDEQDLLANVLAATAAEGHGTLMPGVPAAAARSAASPEARALAQVERMIASLLGRIVEHPRFLALATRWRALHRLAQGIAPDGGAGIALGCATRREIVRDLLRAPSLDETLAWRALVAEGLDPVAPRPFAALLVDEEWGADPEDVDCLQLMGGIAAAAHAVVLTNAVPALLGGSAGDRLPSAGELRRRMDAPSHARWRSFRESDEARHIVLALPRLGPRADASPGAGRTIGAAWLLAAGIGAGFAESGWGITPADWRAEGWTGDVVPMLRIDDPLALAEQGIIGIAALDAGSVLPHRRTAQRPKRYDRELATLQAAARARLDHVLAVGRFAQALTILGQQAGRAGGSPQAVRDRLARWIARHAAGEDAPLAEARIDIQPPRGGAGPAIVAWLAPRLHDSEGSHGNLIAPDAVLLDVL